jgi:hypothetical protein
MWFSEGKCPLAVELHLSDHSVLATEGWILVGGTGVSKLALRSPNPVLLWDGSSLQSRLLDETKKLFEVLLGSVFENVSGVPRLVVADEADRPSIWT